MKITFATALCFALGLAAPAQAAQFNFCWQGAGGYTMTGVIGFPDRALSSDMVTERDLTRFEITGYENLIPVGRWTLDDRKPGSTFHVRFDPQTMTFPTGGSFPGNDSQGWNANGDVTGPALVWKIKDDKMETDRVISIEEMQTLFKRVE